MIKNHFAIVFFLLFIEAAVLYISGQGRFKKYFRFIPAVFWIYFLPMVVSTVGLIDARSEIYQLISKHLLPASLLLLLLSSDIRSILRLGAPALGMMLAGSAGIMLGTPLMFLLFKRWVGPGSWSGFGALSASWIGGSANMIAVKEALGTPDAVFLPMVVVDTIVPYVWMGILAALVSIQPLYDRWNRAQRTILDGLSCKISDFSVQKTQGWRMHTTILILLVAVLGTRFSQLIANTLPVNQAVSAYAWTIVIVSFLGIILSFTPLKRLENFGLSRIGYFLLYFVLTSIGAKANLSCIGQTPMLILAGFLIVFFHAGVLAVASRVIRAPMFLVATASQANIGGVASAPVIAAIYQPGLASVGLLLAILGNIIGTYLGILTGHFCYTVSGW